jgi:outer membrane protein TolC
MVGPDFKSPASPHTLSYTHQSLPKKTVSTSSSGSAGQAQSFVTGKDLPGAWWEAFHSKALNQLVEQGIANSPTLASAQATLKVAQETLIAERGTLLFPQLDATLSAERQRFVGSQFGLNSESNVFNLFNASFNASYILDVFGGARRQVEAYAALVDYNRYLMLGAYLTLTSNIVTTAITVASEEAQAKATQRLIAAQAVQLEVMKKQFQLGGISQLDILTQDAALPHLDLNHLILPSQLPVSLPSKWVTQRPDIQAQTALLHQASAQVGVATANLLPQITLNGGYGWSSDTASLLLNPKSVMWNMTTNFTQPIFEGGALRAARRAAIANYESVFATYRQVVLQAFSDVANALHALHDDARTFRASRSAEVASRKTLWLTRKQYQLGAVSYLSVLNAETQYQTAVISRIQSETLRYNDTVALFQSLGGGWWHRPSLLEQQS